MAPPGEVLLAGQGGKDFRPLFSQRQDVSPTDKARVPIPAPSILNQPDSRALARVIKGGPCRLVLPARAAVTMPTNNSRYPSAICVLRSWLIVAVLALLRSY